MLRANPGTSTKKIGLTFLFSGVVAVSIILTIAIAIFISYQSEKQTLFETTLAMNYSNAQDISSTIDSLFKSMSNSLQLTSAHVKDYSGRSEQEILDYLDLTRNTGGYFNSIILADEKGTVQNATPVTVTIGQTLVSEAAKQSLATKRSYLSSPYIGTTGRLIVLMTEPIFDQAGAYKGFIGGTIYLQEDNVLSSIFKNNTIDTTGSYYYVVDPTGRLLFHPDKSRLGEDASANKVIRKLMHKQSGKDEVVNTKGIHFLAGYVSVPGNGWGVVVQTPVATVYAKLYQHIKELVLYMLPPSIILMLLAIMVARKLANPFVALAGAVHHSTRLGKPAVPPFKQHWNREADVLTKTFMTALASMQKQTDRLSQAAMTDPLTGLSNRRTMESVMRKWTAEGTRYAVILMDIDRFKAVNDMYGHQVGDEVLKHAAGIMVSCSRADDVCCRFGGEEFVVLVHGASTEDAFHTAERIRITLENSPSPTGKPVTASFGICSSAASPDTPEEMLHLADNSLYKAKNEGRNRTAIADRNA
ncbi:hypothetical protein SD70_24080 [Gordoniibacillus kamchatkensis]|uniref:GGDEF domain-containing protein n=1 Tax=Gordoniibacillus kamchatkensis TaxID=1590651 RepID=A0ABR5ACL1_9BACL|nr:sensor domain-containing diguanylate cyclase [Paenibacillus sp. VKM B-2647]KIL38773.1 hypothetical protein SD70_24080 [Paenibacillus sp. VKM B-2647]